MPLCPQITNTPITVTQTADFTVSSVLPVVAATTTQVNAANDAAVTALAEANQAIADATVALATANAANIAATDAAFEAGVAQSTADGKNTVYYGTDSTPGTGNIFGASANGTTITYNAYNGLVVGQTVTISGIANNTAGITNATGNGSTITYTSSNNFVVGQTVTVSGINPSRWDAAGVITAANASSFSIAGTTTGTPAYISGGSATAPSLLNTTGTVATQSFSSFTITSTRRGNYTSGGSLNVSGLTFKVGDIYFQYNTSRQIIAQSTYDGSAFQSTPITNTVIANLDAGKITAGTITGIAYNNGSGTFSVSPTGTLVASNANITGNINATSGTFVGTVTATSGSFTGTITSSNATITGGTLTVGANFSVTSTGVLTATSANITGAITATSGSFTGTVNANSGTIGGFTLSSTSIFSGTNLVIESTGNISGGNSQTLFYGFVNIGGGFASGERLIVTGNSSFVGSIIASNNITSQNDYYYPFPNVVTGTANLRVLPGSTPAGRIVDNGASSERYKHDIVNLIDVPELDPRKLYELPVRAFRYNLDYLSASDDRYDVLIPGFIAEEVDEIYPLAADYEGTIGIHTWNDRMLIPAMMALIQDLHKEIQTLKGE